MFICKKRKIIKLYKELKGCLNSVDLFDSLYVLWAHIQYLQFNNQFPVDIVVPLNIMTQNRPTRGIYEWELITLAKELIINSPENKFATRTFKDWRSFSEAVNKLKRLEEEINYCGAVYRLK